MISVSVSLRGSLAGEYVRLRETGNKASADVFVESLLLSDDPDVIRLPQDTAIVIGRHSERGQFFPDIGKNPI